MIVMFVYESLRPDFLNILPYIVITGYFLIHAGNRYYKTFFLFASKAFMCVYAGLLLIDEPLTGLILGFTVFTLLELLLYRGIKNKVTRPMESSSSNINYLNRLAQFTEVFVYLALATHLIQDVLSSQKPPDYLLYLLIPYMVFCYRRLSRQYLGYMAVGIFAYTNGFIAMQFYDLFIQHNLNTSHLLSISVIFTITVFLIYDKVVTAKRTEVTI